MAFLKKVLCLRNFVWLRKDRLFCMLLLFSFQHVESLETFIFLRFYLECVFPVVTRTLLVLVSRH